MRFLMSPRWTS